MITVLVYLFWILPPACVSFLVALGNNDDDAGGQVCAAMICMLLSWVVWFPGGLGDWAADEKYGWALAAAPGLLTAAAVAFGMMSEG